MTKRQLPSRLMQPLPLRVEDETHRPTILNGGHRVDYLDVPRVLDEIRDRFGLLWQHYDIDPNGPDAWKGLAVALAFDHVPGFRMTKPGRSKSGVDYVARFDEVRQSSNRRALSNAEIAGRIAKQDGVKGSTVLRRYQEQKARSKARLSPDDERRLIAAMFPHTGPTILGK